MKRLTATEAARGLSEVLDAVEGGERFVIVRHGRVVARLEPASAGTGRIVKGLLRDGPDDESWLAELRKTRAKASLEDRRWSD